MKPFFNLKLSISLCILVLICLQSGPDPAEAGPAATAACILACCGSACSAAAAVCKLEVTFVTSRVKS